MLEPRPRIFSPQPERFGAADGCMWVTYICWIYVQVNIYPENVVTVKRRSNGSRNGGALPRFLRRSADMLVGRGSRTTADVYGESSAEPVIALITEAYQRPPR